MTATWIRDRKRFHTDPHLTHNKYVGSPVAMMSKQSTNIMFLYKHSNTKYESEINSQEQEKAAQEPGRSGARKTSKT